MKGIDIASMQGVVDFAKVKASGIEIVYIKATEGLTYNSPTMLTQYNGARAVGLKTSFYHYLRANNPEDEADHFMSVVKGLPVECKYAIDVEVTLGQTKAQIVSNIRRFADRLIANGLKVIVYTGDAFYSAYIANTIADNLGMWIAHYHCSRPDKIGIGFQYSESGRLDGINGDVDLDTFTNEILLNSAGTVYAPIALPSQPVVYKGDPYVGIIQTQLNAMMKPSPLLVVDGFGGDKTTEQIKRFQTVCNITVDGKWGPQCIACVNLIYAKTVCGLPYVQRVPTRLIQYRMGIKFDGVFGTTTDKVVRAWQKANNLVVDGKVGDASWKKLIG